MDLIAKALLKAQASMTDAKKDTINPFFKKKYADLNSIREACMPAFNENGISILQPIVYDNGKSFVKTLLLHESGQSIEGMTEIVCAKQNDPQSYGSALTYARRYGLQSLCNVGCEDDDANSAMPNTLENALAAMDKCKTLQELANVYKSFDKATQSNPSIIAKKEILKANLK